MNLSSRFSCLFYSLYFLILPSRKQISINSKSTCTCLCSVVKYFLCIIIVGKTRRSAWIYTVQSSQHAWPWATENGQWNGQGHYYHEAKDRAKAVWTGPCWWDGNGKSWPIRLTFPLCGGRMEFINWLLGLL